MVIALGVTLGGEKVVLGFAQTGTENAVACAAFLRGLVERGLRVGEGLLVVVDGSKGLIRAVREVFGTQAVVQRCRWHKAGERGELLAEGAAGRVAGEAAARVEVADLRGCVGGAPAIAPAAEAGERGRRSQPGGGAGGDLDPSPAGGGRGPGRQPEY